MCFQDSTCIGSRFLLQQLPEVIRACKHARARALSNVASQERAAFAWTSARLAHGSDPNGGGWPPDANEEWFWRVGQNCNAEMYLPIPEARTLDISQISHDAQEAQTKAVQGLQPSPASILRATPAQGEARPEPVNIMHVSLRNPSTSKALPDSTSFGGN